MEAAKGNCQWRLRLVHLGPSPTSALALHSPQSLSILLSTLHIRDREDREEGLWKDFSGPILVRWGLHSLSAGGASGPPPCSRTLRVALRWVGTESHCKTAPTVQLAPPTVPGNCQETLEIQNDLNFSSTQHSASVVIPALGPASLHSGAPEMWIEGGGCRVGKEGRGRQSPRLHRQA